LSGISVEVITYVDGTLRPELADIISDKLAPVLGEFMSERDMEYVSRRAGEYTLSCLELDGEVEWKVKDVFTRVLEVNGWSRGLAKYLFSQVGKSENFYSNKWAPNSGSAELAAA
jgi:hypothetical protein